MTDQDIQVELQKIDDALKVLEAVFSGEALAAAQKPLLDKRTVLVGSGALAQGDGNLVVGQDGIGVGGSVGGNKIGRVKEIVTGNEKA